MKHLLILLVGLFLLSACSVFSPIKTETTTSYLINTTPQPLTARASHRLNLLVTQPEADSIYNTTGIAYTTKPHQIGYFVKSTWAEVPTQMLHPLIIQTLRKTHFFHRVGTLSSVGHYDYLLNTQLIQLQQDYSQLPPAAYLILNAEIVKASTNQVIASHEFVIHEMIRQNSTYSGVIATNRATAIILNQLAVFCLKTLQRSS